MRISDWSSDVCSSDLLNAGPDDANFGGLPKLRFEPGPLILAQHARRRVEIGPVGADAPGASRGPVRLRHLQDRRPVVAGIQQDELQPPARRTVEISGMNSALAGAPVAGLRIADEVEEDQRGRATRRERVCAAG